MKAAHAKTGEGGPLLRTHMNINPKQAASMCKLDRNLEPFKQVIDHEKTDDGTHLVPRKQILDPYSGLSTPNYTYNINRLTDVMNDPMWSNYSIDSKNMPYRRLLLDGTSIPTEEPGKSQHHENFVYREKELDTLVSLHNLSWLYLDPKIENQVLPAYCGPGIPTVQHSSDRQTDRFIYLITIFN